MSLLDQGGWVLVAIFSVSTLAWILILLQWMRLRGETRGAIADAREILRRLESGGREAAIQLCQTGPQLLRRLFRAALEIAEGDRARFRRRLRPVWRAEVSRLRRHLGMIHTLGVTATLLGLLGTVLGIVRTFAALTVDGSARVEELTGSISQALITTQAGLMVAVPILLMHHWLRSRIRRASDRIALYLLRVERVLFES